MFEFLNKDKDQDKDKDKGNEEPTMKDVLDAMKDLREGVGNLSKRQEDFEKLVLEPGDEEDEDKDKDKLTLKEPGFFKNLGEAEKSELKDYVSAISKDSAKGEIKTTLSKKDQESLQKEIGIAVEDVKKLKEKIGEDAYKTIRPLMRAISIDLAETTKKYPSVMEVFEETKKVLGKLKEFSIAGEKEEKGGETKGKLFSLRKPSSKPLSEITKQDKFKTKEEATKAAVEEVLGADALKGEEEGTL